jgi:hypothetical protein
MDWTDRPLETLTLDTGENRSPAVIAKAAGNDENFLSHSL